MFFQNLHCIQLTILASHSQDISTENEFEKRLLADVIPPHEIGVTFEDIGALESVKDTLKELVMLPLQRPELFNRGQLMKVDSWTLLVVFSCTICEQHF